MMQVHWYVANSSRRWHVSSTVIAHHSKPPPLKFVKKHSNLITNTTQPRRARHTGRERAAQREAHLLQQQDVPSSPSSHMSGGSLRRFMSPATKRRAPRTPESVSPAVRANDGDDNSFFLVYWCWFKFLIFFFAIVYVFCQFNRYTCHHTTSFRS